ncbi:hypothetical protein D3C79_739400 [compost metagenome]
MASRGHCPLVGKPACAPEQRADNPAQADLPARPLSVFDRRELRRCQTIGKRPGVADLVATRAAGRKPQQRFATPCPLLAEQRIQHGNRGAHTAVIDRRTGQVEQGVNLGQARIETLDTAEVIQVIVGIERHEPSHLLQVARQLAAGRQPMQEWNGAPHAAPAQNLQTGLKRLLLITGADTSRQPLTQLPKRALGLHPGFRVDRALVAVAPACLPAVMLKDLLYPLYIDRQTAGHKLAGLESQLEGEYRQVGCQPFNESLNFGLCQEVITLHASRLAGSVEWPYPKQNDRLRPRCLFIQVNNWSRFECPGQIVSSASGESLI